MIGLSSDSLSENTETSDNFKYEWTESEPPIQDMDYSDPLSAYIKIAVGLVLVLIILISILGNIMVCLAISSDRRLRRLGNLFLASLGL